jgi:outer membrane protein OmpA-like peptidoglycan-associated protein
MRKFILMGLIACTVAVASAQNSDHKWSIGLFGGKTEYNGDLGNAFIKFDKAFYPFGAISINRYLNPSFDLGVYSSYGEYGYKKTPARRFFGEKFDVSLLLTYKLSNGYIFKEDALVTPYISAGVGMAHYHGNRVWNGRDYIIPVGGGLKLNITNWFALQYQLLYNFTSHDKRDHQPTNGHNEQYAAHSVGFVFSFGKMRDQDKDGVKDKYDLCPTVPGVVALKGCPDTDGDGIADADDKCPNEAGTVENQGCPDRDGDGIIDSEDRCPDAAGPAALKGCPDRDGDGVADIDDRCPDTPGLVRFQGCPDTDGDGVPDIDDRCPNEAGPASNNGCPVAVQPTKEEHPLPPNIQFELNKADLKKESFKTLDNVVKKLNDNPEYGATIYGYTDITGNDNINNPLSESRAKAVRDYLIKKGIAADRITTLGKGSENPVADNATRKGRILNRRSEIFLVF